VTRIAILPLTVRPRPNSVPGLCITSRHTAGSLGVISLSLPPYTTTASPTPTPLSPNVACYTEAARSVAHRRLYRSSSRVRRRARGDTPRQPHSSPAISVPYTRVSSPTSIVTSQTLPRVCSARIANPRRAAFSFTRADDTRPLTTQFRTSAPRMCTPAPTTSSPAPF
jgi:hypothetical protein